MKSNPISGIRNLWCKTIGQLLLITLSILFTTNASAALGTAVLNSPLNGQQVIVSDNANVCFSWQPATEATEYALLVSTTSDFSSEKWTKKYITGTSSCWDSGVGFIPKGTAPAVPESLTPGTKYYWRVNAWIRDIPTPVLTKSETRYFNAVWGTPILSTPTGPTSSTTGSYRISWSVGTHSPTIYYLYRKSSSTGLAVIHIGTELFFDETNLPTEDYEYYAVGCNASKCGWSPAKKVSVRKPLGVVTLSQPTNPTTVSYDGRLNQCFSWNAVTNATHYALQLSETTDFSSQKWMKINLTGTSACFGSSADWLPYGANFTYMGSGSLPNSRLDEGSKTYYWRVIAKDGLTADPITGAAATVFSSRHSETRTWQVGAIPPTISDISGINGHVRIYPAGHTKAGEAYTGENYSPQFRVDATDPDGDPLTYAWSIVEGEAEYFSSNLSAIDQPIYQFRTKSFTGSSVNAYIRLRVTVTDPGGLSTYLEKSIHMNHQPVLTLTNHNATGMRGSFIEFSSQLDTLNFSGGITDAETTGNQLFRYIRRYNEVSLLWEYWHFTTQTWNVSATGTHQRQFDYISGATNWSVNNLFGGNQFPPKIDFQPTVYRYYFVVGAYDMDWIFGSKTQEFYINAKPQITAHEIISMESGTPLALTRAMLTINDLDDSTGHSVKIGASSASCPIQDYQVSGSSITSNAGFIGPIKVPVIVNDGTEDSDVYCVDVTVNAPPVSLVITNLQLIESVDQNNGMTIIGLSWDPIDGLLPGGYYEVTQTTPDNRVIVEQVTDSNWTSIPQSRQGMHNFAVKACHSATDCGESVFENIDINAGDLIIAAIPLTPIESAVVIAGDNGPCFTWQASTSENITDYTIQVTDMVDFSAYRWVLKNITGTSACWNGGVKWISTGTGTLIPPPAKLEAGTTYIWRVNTKNGVFVMPSEPENFSISTETLTPPASITVPGSDDDQNFDISWTVPADASVVDHYELEERLGVDDEFTQIYSGSDLSQTLTNRADGSWFYRVRACQAVECSVYVEGGPLVSTFVMNTTPETPPAPHVEAIPGEPLTSTTIGSLPDTLLVDSSGSAKFQVDIVVPDGIRGTKPSLSLNYDSQSGMGLMGVGWNLSGTSSIARCRKTLETDGYVRGVKLDNDDAICLNGQRLMNVAGVPWVNLAQYRTEIESNQRVTFHDVGSYFQVELSNGEQLEYGNTLDSSLNAINQGTTYKWLLSKRTDTFGNEITYTYTGSDSTGRRISSINYSGNRVDFVYKIRPDARFIYFLGNRIENDQRLTDIEVFNHNNIQINHYEVNYRPSTFSNRSLVENIQRCVSKGVTCLNPTNFNYSEPSIGLSAVKLNHALNHTGKDIISLTPADINGDGKPELVLTYAIPTTEAIAATTIEVFQYENQQLTSLHQFNTLAVVKTSGSITSYQPLMLIGDADGNGTDDIAFGKACPSGSDCTWDLNYFDKDAVVSHTQTYNWKATAARDWMFSDMDSDGRLDLFTGIGFYKNTGSQTTNFSAFQEIMEFNPESQELNAELALKNIGAGNNSVLDDAGFWQLRDGFRRPADINGDGQPDLISSYYFTECHIDDLNFVCSDGPPQVRLVSASYLRPYILEQTEAGVWNWTPPNALDIDIDPLIAQLDDVPAVLPRCTSNADFNGDGLIDFFADDRLFLADGFGFKPYYFDGDTTNCFIRGQDEDIFWQALDLNADGLADELYSTGTGVYARLNTGKGFAPTPILMFDTNISYARFDQILWTDLDGDGLIGSVHLDKLNGKIIIREDSEAQFKGPDVLVQVEDGFNAKSTISYKPLTDTSVYQMGDDAEALNWGNGSGVFDIISSSAVVSELNKEHVYNELGVLNSLTSQYQYGALRLQYGGRGFLGFESFTETDVTTNIVTQSTYRQDFPFNGNLSEVIRSKAGKTLYQLTNNSFYNVSLNAGKNQFVAVSDATEITKQFDVTNGVLSANTSTVVTKDTINSFVAVGDSYVNNTSQAITLTDGFSTDVRTATTIFDYLQEDEGLWLISRPTTSTTTSTRTGKPNIVNKQNMSYATDGAYLEFTEVEPLGAASVYLKTALEYDSFGNVIKQITCSNHYKDNCDSTANPVDLDDDNQKIFRVNSSVYDAAGRNLTSLSNREFTLSTFEQFDNWNRPIRMTETSGVTTKMRFDAFGKEYFMKDNTGAFVSTTFADCTVGCPANSAYKITKNGAGDVNAIMYFDFKGREIKSSQLTFNGTYSHTEAFYDELGRAVKVSEPYFTGNTKHHSLSEYDVFGRELSSTSAAAVTTSNDYVLGEERRTVSGNFSGSIGAWTAPISQSITKTNNGFGELLSINDNLTNTIVYSYDAKGSLLTATGVDLAVISNTYDVLQRRLSIDDPDKGLWTTGYNALGETIQTIAPDNVTSVSFYDSAGRLTDSQVKSSSAPAASTIETSSNIYAGAFLESQTVSTGSETSYLYDGFGRLSNKSVSIDGFVFNTGQTYDQFGRLFQKFDASGADRGLAYSYKNGTIATVYETQGSGLSQSTTKYYQVSSVDARGNVTLSTQGNGIDTVKIYNQAAGFLQSVSTGNSANVQSLSYEFDGLGNLRAREDKNQQINAQDLNEVFGYDALNRVNKTLMNSVETLSLTYAGNGNILSKSDVAGTYTYANPIASCSENSAGPHALTAVGTKSYCYDKRGNQTHTYSSSVVSREVQYSHFDKPLSIESSAETTDFQYDTNRNRIKRIDTKSAVSSTTYYADGIEFMVSASGTTKFKRYLDGHAIHDVGDSVNEISYVHTDHLGSMDVFTDELGNVKERLSFDTFGQRRNSLDWSGSLTSELLQSIADITKRGYTGHEHIDHASVVHMNGRIYDPITGRFMQADPIIQEVKNSQNYNRYSYVLNNPLSYTDPTGYSFFTSGPGGNSPGAGQGATVEQEKPKDKAGDFSGEDGTVVKLDGSKGDQANFFDAGGSFTNPITNAQPTTQPQTETQTGSSDLYRGFLKVLGVASKSPAGVAILAAFEMKEAGRGSELTTDMLARGAINVAIREAEERGEDTLTLFRVAGPTESRDIRAKGVFRLGPNEFPKQFILSMVDALDFQKALPTLGTQGSNPDFGLPHSIFSGQTSFDAARALTPGFILDLKRSTLILTAPNRKSLGQVNKSILQNGGIKELNTK